MSIPRHLLLGLYSREEERKAWLDTLTDEQLAQAIKEWKAWLDTLPNKKKETNNE